MATEEQIWEHRFREEPSGLRLEALLECGMALGGELIVVCNQTGAEYARPGSGLFRSRMLPHLIDSDTVKRIGPGTRTCSGPSERGRLFRYRLSRQAIVTFVSEVPSLYGLDREFMSNPLVVLPDGRIWLRTVCHERYGAIYGSEAEREALRRRCPVVDALLLPPRWAYERQDLLL